MAAMGSMWVRDGRVVVFRQLESHHSKGPKLGLVIGETDDGLLKIRTACGARRYCARVVEIEPEFIAREASEREAALGYPVGPVPPAPSATK